MNRKHIYVFISLVSAFALVFNLPSDISKKKSASAQSVQAHTVFCETNAEYSIGIDGVNAESAVLMDADGRTVLYGKNADRALGMASTTKIMTALVAIENCLPEKEFSIPEKAVGIEGSSVYLQAGERLTLEELLYCLLLESGNDAAVAVAICVGGSEEAFTEMMNERAKELGLSQTHFANPHGLSAENHRTTAKELAVITAEAMQYPLFKQICATENFSVRYNGVPNGRYLSNHNKLLKSFDGANGVKTGYTAKDGKCLVSSAERDGLTLIAVTLDDSFPTGTHRLLLEAGFENFRKTTVAEKGEIRAYIPLINGETEHLEVYNADDISLCLPKNAVFETELLLPESMEAPVGEGELLGKAKVTVCGDKVYIINLEISQSVNLRKKSFWEKIFGEK